MPSSRRRSHGAEEEEHTGERWLLTYADVITLLLVLFIMLFAISTLDKKKFQAFREAFNEGEGQGVDDQAFAARFNPPDAGAKEARPGKPGPPPTAAAKDTKRLKELERRLRTAISQVGLSKSVSVAIDDRGVVVFVTDGVLFASGEADLLPGGQRLLDSLAPVFATVANDLVVEGHTDNVPISSAAFASNWELSTSRATTVLRFLISRGQLNVKRMSASGYADTRPRVQNDTPEHRSDNRRVEVVVLVPRGTSLVQPASSQTTR